MKNQNRLTYSVEPDETAHYEQAHLDLHCLRRYLFLSAGLKGLTLSMPGKIFSRRFTEIYIFFLLFCPENRL